jgi:sarcosine oxidase subunit beta
VGTSIAYHLAKRGQRVVTVDRGGVASGTSAATFELIWVHSKEPAHYMEMSLRSARMFPGLVAELDADVRLEQNGGLTLCVTDKDVEGGHALVRRQSASPLYRGRVLDARETHALQPGLSDEIVGAVYSPDDGHIDSFQYDTALARAAERGGARFLTNTEATGIALRNGAVAGVQTSRGFLSAPHVVNAAGPWAGVVSLMAGVRLPIQVIRGQIVITRPATRVLRLPMSGIRQDSLGHYFLGFTNEHVGYDTRTTYDGIRKIVQNAARKVPAVAQAQVLRVFAGVRSMPEDGLPCLGSVPSVKGFYVAVSHSGVTLSPMHGTVIADLICDGRTDQPIEPFDPTRFDRMDEVTRQASFKGH